MSVDIAKLVMELSSRTSLADVVRELGPSCTSTKQQFVEVLGLFPSVDEESVARMLSVVARRMDVGPVPWKPDVVIEAFREKCPHLNWPKVVQFLDNPDFLCPDAKAFAFIAMVYRFSSKEPFPIATLCRPWNNSQGQLSFLRWAVEAAPEIVSFETSPRRAVPVEGLQGGRDPRGTANQVHCYIVYAKREREACACV